MLTACASPWLSKWLPRQAGMGDNGVHTTAKHDSQTARTTLGALRDTAHTAPLTLPEHVTRVASTAEQLVAASAQTQQCVGGRGAPLDAAAASQHVLHHILTSHQGKSTHTRIDIHVSNQNDDSQVKEARCDGWGRMSTCAFASYRCRHANGLRVRAVLQRRHAESTGGDGFVVLWFRILGLLHNRLGTGGDGCHVDVVEAVPVAAVGGNCRGNARDGKGVW